MANYTVKDTQTGKTITFAWNGNAAPTDADMEQVFSAARGQTAEPSFLDKAKKVLSSLPNAALETLPVVGATAGGILSAPPSAALGPFAPAGVVGGATLGGATGKATENFLRQATGIGKPDDVITSPLQSGAEMGAFEMGVGPVIRAIEKIAAPAAKAMTEGGKKLYDFASKYELPFSASSINPSKIASAVETFVNLFPSGKYVTSKYQAQLYKKFLDTRSEVLGELTGTAKSMTGKTLQEGIKDTREILRDSSIEAYANIVPAAGGKDTIILTPRLREFLDNVLESPRVQKNPILAKYLDANYTRTTTGMNAKELDSFQRNIWGKTGKDRELGRELWTALEGDVKEFDQKAGKTLYDSIQNARSTGRAQYDYGDISGIFQRSSVIRNGEEFFQPDKFYSIVMNPKNQATIKRAYGEDALQNMVDYAEFSRKAAMESSKRNLSGMQKVWQEAMTMGGIGGSTFVNPAIAVPYGMSYVMGNMIMKPQGVFKKWLTEGFSVSEGAKEALKVGGRAAISKRNE